MQVRILLTFSLLDQVMARWFVTKTYLDLWTKFCDFSIQLLWSNFFPGGVNIFGFLQKEISNFLEWYFTAH